MEHLLEMRNLSIDLYKGKKTPAVKLVEGIDLTLEKRQNFGVVGESGCGKSITCSSIMGLLSFPLSVGAGSSIRFQREDGSVQRADLPAQSGDAQNPRQRNLHDFSGADDRARPDVYHRRTD